MGCEAKSPTGKKIPRENYFSQDALFLFSFDSEGKLVLDSEGKPEVRLCNFEFVRHRGGGAPETSSPL